MIKLAYDLLASTSNKVWLLARDQSVGASTVGGCSRKAHYEKNQDDPSAPQPDPDFVDSYGAKMRGTVMEDALFVPAMRLAYGDNFIMGGDDQRTLVLDFLSATPDGLLINQSRDALKHLGVADIEGDCIVVECKTVDPRINPESLPKPENTFQAIVQLGMIRALTPYKPMWAVISYTDCSFWDQVREFPIRFDPRVFEIAKLRAKDIMLAHAANDLRPEGAIAGGKECERCAFTRACGQARAAYVPRADKILAPAELSSIAAQARTARTLKVESERLAKESREAEAKLRDMLADAGTRRIEGDGVKVRWSAVKGRSSIDNVALREAAVAAGIDVTAFQRIGAASDQLAISLTKGGAHESPDGDQA